MIFKKKWILAFVLALAIRRVSATVISNLNVIFETYGPLSLVRFFEFNDIGWNISEKCIKDMFLYLDGLHKDILWAVKCLYHMIFYSQIKSYQLSKNRWAIKANKKKNSSTQSPSHPAASVQQLQNFTFDCPNFLVLKQIHYSLEII